MFIANVKKSARARPSALFVVSGHGWMARLKRLRSRIGSFSTPLSTQPRIEAERSRHRDATQPWRRWYKTKRWQRLRWSILERDGFQCQFPDCGRIHHDASQLVADHKRPHRGDESLFWDPENIQALCKSPCHDRWKQQMERRGIL